MKFAGARTPRLKLTMAKPANIAVVQATYRAVQYLPFVQIRFVRCLRPIAGISLRNAYVWNVVGI